MDLSFYLLGVNPNEHDCRIAGLSIGLLGVVRNCQSSKGAAPFCTPTSYNESRCCSKSALALGDASVLTFSHSNRCVVVSRGCFTFPHFEQ